MRFEQTFKLAPEELGAGRLMLGKRRSVPNKPISTLRTFSRQVGMDFWHIFMVLSRADCQLGSPNGHQRR